MWIRYVTHQPLTTAQYTRHTIPTLHRDLPGQPLSRRLDSILSVIHHERSGCAGRCRVVTPAGIRPPLHMADPASRTSGPAHPHTRTAPRFPSSAREHQRTHATAPAQQLENKSE